MFIAPAIYPIVDVEVCRQRGLEPLELAAAYLRGGARVMQLRWKDHGSGAMLNVARRMAALATPFGAALVVNDRADVARLARAAAVHVGQDDLTVEDACAVAGPGVAVGVSTHDRAQVDAALAGPAAYVAVGPIYGTATKDTGYEARGLDLVRYAAGRGKAVVAIGGITLDHVPELVAAGAMGLAVISDLVGAGDPEARVRAYVDMLGSVR